MVRQIAMVAYPGVQSLDVVGPLEVFSTANRFDRHGAMVNDGRASAYRVDVVTTTGSPFAASSGLTMLPTRRLDQLRRVDTVVVAGGTGTPEAMRDSELLAWLREIAPKTRRIASVCSGAFVLAAAGLLAGRRATTHWSECDRLANMFDDIVVESDPIFVRDGNIATSAGVTAGMDLALAFVEEDLGRDVALAVARWLVMFVGRPGGQSQFSAQLSGQQSQREELRDLQLFIAEHPTSDLSVGALCSRVAMSERNFARVFSREVGVTPGEYVERTRVEVARRLLQETSLSLELVAHGSGFGSAETLRRAFHRQISVAPRDYRSRFHAVAP